METAKKEEERLVRQGVLEEGAGVAKDVLGAAHIAGSADRFGRPGTTGVRPSTAVDQKEKEKAGLKMVSDMDADILRRPAKSDDAAKDSQSSSDKIVRNIESAPAAPDPAGWNFSYLPPSTAVPGARPGTAPAPSELPPNPGAMPLSPEMKGFLEMKGKKGLLDASLFKGFKGPLPDFLKGKGGLLLGKDGKPIFAKTGLGAQPRRRAVHHTMALYDITVT